MFTNVPNEEKKILFVRIRTLVLTDSFRIIGALSLGDKTNLLKAENLGGVFLCS
jgi:hypothetical protein